MRSMTAGAALLVLGLGCGGGRDAPLTAEELAPFQACAAKNDCVLARNAPRTCCSETLFRDVVAVARASVGPLEMELAELECAALEACEGSGGPSVLEDRYELDCVANRCAIVAEHEHSGEACDLSCPAEYACIEGTCFYEPRAESCSRVVMAPRAPLEPLVVTPPQFECLDDGMPMPGPYGSQTCTAPSRLSLEFAACEADGFPTGLPADGTPIVRVAAGESITAAIDSAAEGTIIALGAGTYTENLHISKSVTLWGCTTVIVPPMISRPAVLVDRGSVTLRSLTIDGETIGVQAVGSLATLLLDRVWIAEPAEAGLVLTNGARATGGGVLVNGATLRRGIGRAVSLETGASLFLTHSELRDNVESGLVAQDSGTHADLQNVWIHDNGNTGVAALDGALITGLAWTLERNTAQGMVAERAVIELEHGWISFSAQDQPDTARGFGAVALNGGLMTIGRVVFDGNRNASLLAFGADAVLTAVEVVVLSTLAGRDGAQGASVVAANGGRAVIRDAVLTGSLSFGAIAQDPRSKASLENTIVAEVQDGVAVAASAGGELNWSTGESSTIDGGCARAEGTASLLTLGNVRVRQCDRGAGVNVFGGARFEARRSSVSQAKIAGIVAQGTGTSFSLEDVVIEAIAPELEDGPGGFGLALADGAEGGAEALAVRDVLHAGVLVSGASLELSDGQVQRVGVSRSGSAGRGISVERGGQLRFRSAAISETQEAGVAALSDGTGVSGVELRVEDTVGIGVAAYRGASVEVDGFLVSGSSVANLARGATSRLVLGTGRSEKAPIGLALEGASDPQLLDQVCFSENEVDVDSDALGVPADVEFP